MSGGRGALSQRLRDPLLSRPKGCLVHVHSFITCLMGTLGSGMVFGLQKITDQEIHSLHPQKLSLGGKTHSEADNYMCFSVVRHSPSAVF